MTNYNKQLDHDLADYRIAHTTSNHSGAPAVVITIIIVLLSFAQYLFY